MKLQFDDRTEAFRAEFARWLDENAPDPADTAERSTSSADVPGWARLWQRRMFDAGWQVGSLSEGYARPEPEPEAQDVAALLEELLEGNEPGAMPPGTKLLFRGRSFFDGEEEGRLMRSALAQDARANRPGGTASSGSISAHD